MKRYDSYKESGTIWFNEVPKNWIVTKIKYFCYKVVNGATPSTDNPSYWDGDIPWIPSGMCHDCEIVEADKFITEEGYCNSSTKKIPANTTLVALTGATCSKTGYLLFESCTNQSIAALINRNGTFSKYFFYLLQSLRPQLLTYQTGGAQAGVNVGNCKNLIGLFPSYKEQKNICSYLDSKCGEIDKVISTQEKRIALLQELKQSIITHAVTKGLNPDVKIKDSGIEWIGEVPEHWEICKIKNILIKGKNGIKIGPFGSSLTGNVGEGLPYKLYGQWNIIDRDFTAGINTINQIVYNRLSNYKVVEGDILVSMMGTIGKCATVPKNIKDGVMDSHVVKISLNKSLFDNRYFEYFYDKDYSNIAFNEINKLKGGSIMDGLNSSIIKNLSITVPPLYEQQEIASYLDKRCAQIDASICKAQREIELLQEYKQSLITEVVTGKRKVC